MYDKIKKIIIFFTFGIFSLLNNDTGIRAEIILTPGPDSYEVLQEALILAEPNSEIFLSEGVYEFEDGLSLDVDNVTISGAGIDKTILSFKKQKSGPQGLLITSDGITLRDFAVEDTIGDAIVAKKVQGIRFIRIRTEWTGGPKSTNGAYGIYPVESTDVLIDSCIAIGASDAGIYVGQSERIKVINSEARYNVAGIEIENSYHAEVTGNIAQHNTGGILVFDLPNLPKQGGHDILIAQNEVLDNDTPNFAPEGNIVGKTPNGTGIMVMANERVEVRNNRISGNATAGILVVSYLDDYDDKNYNPLPNAIFIHNNKLNNNGFNIDKDRAAPIAEIVEGKAPEIIWDGVTKISEWLGFGGSKRLILGENFKDDGTRVDMINLNLISYALIPWFHSPNKNYNNYEGKMSPIDKVNFKTKWSN